MIIPPIMIFNVSASFRKIDANTTAKKGKNKVVKVIVNAFIPFWIPRM